MPRTFSRSSNVFPLFLTGSPAIRVEAIDFVVEVEEDVLEVTIEFPELVVEIDETDIIVTIP
jgi:hypothetical protein